MLWMALEQTKDRIIVHCVRCSDPSAVFALLMPKQREDAATQNGMLGSIT
jgi:hypothetical protein